MSDDPDLTGRVRLDLSGLVDGLRFAQAVTRRQISRLVRDADARLSGVGSRISAAIGSIDTGRLTAGLGQVVGMIGGLGRLALPFATAGAAVGALLPLVAGLVSTLVNIAPAAAVGVSALIALKLATGTLKLAMTGVGDAVKAALDPASAEAYAEALKKLSPNARAFVQEIHKASPALNAIKRTVQDKVFAGLDKELASTAKATLPSLKRALSDTAGTLNAMGKGVFAAARDLGDKGILGTALKGATNGLANFKRAPGQVVTALGQIGAAAAPAFERLTKAGGSALDRISAKLTKAFESGAMEKAIEQAIDLIGQLASVAGNIGSIFGSIFGAASTSGGGFLGVLESITGEIARVAKTEEVQSGLRALFGVMATLGQTVGPLLAQALQVLGPIFAELGPPIQILITALGQALSPVITALGPVLLAAAQAVGQLIIAVSPLLPVIGELVAALLPALTPLLDACTTVFAALAPVVEQVATILRDTLTPVIAALTPIVEPLAKLIADQLVYWLGFLGDLLVELSPSLIKLGESLAELMIALAPVIVAVADLSAKLLAELAPYLPGLIKVIAALAAILVDVLASNITQVLVPALTIVAQLLSGDFSGALETAKRAAINMAIGVVDTFRSMPGKAREALSGLASAVQRRAIEAGTAFLNGITGKLTDALGRMQALPQRITAALGDVGNLLYSAGVRVISGFIAGIQDRIPSLSGVLSGITSMIPKKKGPPSKDAVLLRPAGRLIIEGFIRGINDSTAKLRQRLASITAGLPANVRSGIGRVLARSTAQLNSLVIKRDLVIKRLATVQKRLKGLVAERDKAAGDITSGILGEANIVQGNPLVNSVGAITVGLQHALKKTQQFAANIAKLRKAGVRADLLQQIADAGVETGGATATALARATPAEIKRINDLQAKLAASAKSTGATVGDALYGAGIRAAQGLVRGLQSQEAAIERQMQKIARAMLAAVKKVHKTRSPSKAFAEIGVMDGEGLRLGILSTRARVQAAMSTVAMSALAAARVVDGAMSGVPQPGQLTASYAAGTGSGGTTNNTFHLHGSDATPDGILRALSWRGLVGGK